MKKQNRNDADRRETSGRCLAAPAFHNPCTHCKGSGHEPLSAHLRATLCSFKDTGKELEASDFVFIDKSNDHISVNAFSNRLRKLYDAGYLLRRKSGKRWLYRRVEEISQ